METVEAHFYLLHYCLQIVGSSDDTVPAARMYLTKRSVRRLYFLNRIDRDRII
jgi:hypothetical protein